MDYKDAIQAEADRIADERYGEDFYHLSPEIQDTVYNEAQAVVWDNYASRGDYLVDKEAYRG